MTAPPEEPRSDPLMTRAEKWTLALAVLGSLAAAVLLSALTGLPVPALWQVLGVCSLGLWALHWFAR